MKIRIVLRILLAMGIFLSAFGPRASTGAHAAKLKVGRMDMQLNRNTFVGVVADVQGLPTDPGMFALVLGTTTTLVRTDQRTKIVGVALEAQVEGVVNGDYALVWARRIKGDLVAARIRYDVAPIPPLHQVIGIVVRVNSFYNRIFLRTAPNRVLGIRVSPNVTYTEQGVPDDGIPNIVKGDTLQTVCLQHNGLIAFQIDVKAAPGGQTRTQLN